MSTPDPIENEDGFKGLSFIPKKYEFIESPTAFRALNFHTNQQQFIESKTGFKGLSFSCDFKGTSYILRHY